MISNIVDRRANKYKWKEVWGVVEPTWADNRCEGADQADYDGRMGSVHYTTEPMMLSELIIWASEFDGNYTLYISESDPMAVVEPEPENEDSLLSLYTKIDRLD